MLFHETGLPGAYVIEPEPKLQPIQPGFPGKVAVVTGGATGLGRAIAHEVGDRKPRERVGRARHARDRPGHRWLRRRQRRCG